MRTLPSILALVAVLLGAGSAQAETSIYVAEQPGFSITLKAEGRHVFVTSLRDTGYCRGTGGHRDEVTEGKGESFLGGPEELERTGRHLHYSEKVTETFYSRTVIDAEIRPDAIVGSYLSESSSSAEGDGGCQTGSPDGDPRVYFTAERYVPLGSELAAAPDPAAAAIYFAGSQPIEIYLWVEDGAVTDVRGSTFDTCISRHRKRPHRRVERSRGAPLLYPPFAVSPADGSFYGTWGFRSSSFGRSSRFGGTVGETEVVGALSETSKVWHRGRVVQRCHTGTGPKGWVPYQATRYVPVAPS